MFKEIEVTNALESEREPDGSVIISIDPYMDIEKEYGLILKDLELLQSFKVKPIIMIGYSHIEEAGKGKNHCNISVANQLYETGIAVWAFFTPLLPHIMDVEEMNANLNVNIPVYIDKLRVFTDGNQNNRVYEWIKREYSQYEKQYYKILFEDDEKYYKELVEKYKGRDKFQLKIQSFQNP